MASLLDRCWHVADVPPPAVLSLLLTNNGHELDRMAL